MTIRFDVTHETTYEEVSAYLWIVDNELTELCLKRDRIIDQLNNVRTLRIEHLCRQVSENGWEHMNPVEIANHPDTMNFEEQFSQLSNESSFYAFAKRLKDPSLYPHQRDQVTPTPTYKSTNKFIASKFLRWARSDNNTTQRDNNPEDAIKLFFKSHSGSYTLLDNNRTGYYDAYLFEFNDSSRVESSYKNEWDIG